MVWQSSPYVYLMAFTGAVSLAVACFTLGRRHTSGSIALALANIGAMIWAWTTSLELASGSFGSAAAFHKLSFLGMDLIGVAWFAFAAAYTGHESWVTPKKLYAISLLPAINQVLVWTSGYHTLVWKTLTLDTTGSFAVIRESPGVWWWVDTVYSYCLLGIGIALLGAMFIRKPGLYRRQVAAVLAGVLVPIAVDAVYTFGMPKSEPVNLTPALFAWVGLALYWGFTRYRLLDVTPVASEFVVKHLGDSVVVTDTQNRAVYLNPAAEKLLGAELRSVAGKPITELMVDSPGLLGAYEMSKRPGAESSQEWEHAGRYYDGRVSTLRDSRNRIRGSILVLRDTTDRKETELALGQARLNLENRVRDRTAELAWEKERLAQLNAVAVEIARCMTSAEVLRAGVRLARDAVGCDAAALWVRSSRDRSRLVGSQGLSRNGRKQLRALLTNSAEAQEAVSTGLPVCITASECTGGNLEVSTEPCFGTIAVIPLISRRLNLGALCFGRNDGRSSFSEETLALGRSIASQIAVALENARRYDDARFLAERDSLTGLLNHRGVSRRLEQELARSESSGSVFALVMIDVDNFKLFNDVYGHVVGDRVLQRVASLLNSVLRRSDAIGRYGGDEFIVIMPGSDVQSAVPLIERLQDSLESHSLHVGDGQDVPIKMSYGVATFPFDGRGVGELLAAADANLYRSKQRGGDRITASGSDDSLRPMPLGSFAALDGLVTTVDKKDHYTRKHSDDVTEYALALASKLGLSLETQRSLRIAALLHDVGKIGVPDRILRKPAKLSEKEFEAVKQHVALGELIIKGIPNPKEVLSAVSSHHEDFDGKGYPRGLKGEEIPLPGRILAVTDAYSAMTSDRPYRKALSVEGAKAELRRVSGSQLDPKVVDAFLELLREDEGHERTQAVLAISA